MSSRKRKRDKRSQANEPVDAATSDGQAEESELADDDSVEESVEPAADADSEQADAAEAPAVSEISELKPRRKRKRGAAEESEPPAVEVVEVTEPAEEEDEEEESFGDEAAKEAPKTRAQLKRVLESLIFVSDQVITAQQLGRISKTKIADVREMLAELSIDYEGRGIDLVEINGGYQFRSAAASAAYVRVLVAARPVRLTRAQLETLALIAYRQPITRPEVDDVRGVDSGSAIKVLLDRELIKILGRKDDAGRPLLYGTTPFFLEFFGMNSMLELPTLREFTELSDEHRELFQRKTNEIGDLSAEADVRISTPRASDSEFEADAEHRSDDAEDAAWAAAPSADEPVAAEANDEVLDDDMVEASDAEASDGDADVTELAGAEDDETDDASDAREDSDQANPTARDESHEDDDDTGA